MKTDNKERPNQIRELWQLDKPEANLFTRIRWDHLRYDCSPCRLVSIATDESASPSYREMAKEVIQIIYRRVFEDDKK